MTKADTPRKIPVMWTPEAHIAVFRTRAICKCGHVLSNPITRNKAWRTNKEDVTYAI